MCAADQDRENTIDVKNTCNSIIKVDIENLKSLLCAAGAVTVSPKVAYKDRNKSQLLDTLNEKNASDKHQMQIENSTTMFNVDNHALNMLKELHKSKWSKFVNDYFKGHLHIIENEWKF